MHKILIAAGVVSLVCSVIIKAESYYNGLMFQTSLMFPIIFFPITLITLIVVFFGLVIRMISVVRRKKKFSTLFLPLAFIFIFMGIQHLPIPTFLDGMHNTVEKSLNRGRLIEFAQQARYIEIDWVKDDEHRKKIELLRKIFPKELSVSKLPPRISVSENAVSVFYGSALTKHWGYSIVKNDECPLKNVPQHYCKKVFDNVWVFQDIW